MGNQKDLKFSGIFVFFLIVSGIGVAMLSNSNNPPVIEDNIVDQPEIIEKDNILKSEKKAPSAASASSWTYMVYLCADNDLEAAGVKDMNEMETVGSTADVNVIVQMDRVDGYDTSNGDWKDARRFAMARDSNLYNIGTPAVQNLGEVNLGTSVALENFIEWGQTNYPADNYALILWDHGSGAMWGPNEGGICFDEDNGNDYLTYSEIATAISGKGLDLLGFDACLMASAEFFYSVADDVEVLVGSEKTEPGDGWPYDTILSWLTSNPSATPEQLGSQIVSKYMNSYSVNNGVTQSAATASLMDELLLATNILSENLIWNMDSIQGTIQTIRAGSHEYDDEPYIDLYAFAEDIYGAFNGVNATIATNAQALMTAIDNSIIVSDYHTATLSDTNGLTVYFPAASSGFSNTYNTLPWAIEGLWDEFLNSYYTGNSGGSGSDDIFENNDDKGSSASILPGYYPNLVSASETDEDWYTIDLLADESIFILIEFSDSVSDLDLFLEASIPLLTNETDTDNEELFYQNTIDQTFFIQVYNYDDNLVNYDLTIVVVGDDDIYEENDEFSAAADLTGQLNNTLEALVAYDVDWYYIDLPNDHDVKGGVLLDYSTTEGDLSMNIYGRYQTEDPVLIESLGTPDDNETYYFSTWEYYFDYDALYIEIINTEDNDNYNLTVGLDPDYDDIYDTVWNNDVAVWNVPNLADGWYLDMVCIDPDFYNITLAEDEWLWVEIEFLNGEGDLDLYLYDPNGEEIAFSVYWGDGEWIVYKCLEAGDYALEVYPYGVNFHYDLYINTTDEFDADIFDGANHFESQANYFPVLSMDTEYNALSSWQDDYFEVSLTQGNEYTISIDYDADESTIVLYLLDDNFDEVDYSFTVGTSEEIVYNPTETGKYYVLIQVLRTVGMYDLLIEEEIPATTTESSSDTGAGTTTESTTDSTTNTTTDTPTTSDTDTTTESSNENGEGSSDSGSKGIPGYSVPILMMGSIIGMLILKKKTKSTQ